MVILLKNNIGEKQVRAFVGWIESLGLRIQLCPGLKGLNLGLLGDTGMLDLEIIKAMEIVEDVQLIDEPYKSANRKFHPENTIIEVGGITIGGDDFVTIAGPCSVESYEQLYAIAKKVKNAGASLLRGGAFKPRTSPYSFQGMGQEGLKLLIDIKKEFELPVVSEIMNVTHLPLFEDIDVIQVGARNMQNFELLKELGQIDKPILLKRGFSSTLQELLMSAEYILAGGNQKVILCERGIRTFETATRNTLDLSAIPLLHSLTHLPVIVDPSHATGIAQLVLPMSLASVAAGADGLMIEVHNNPSDALCDGQQSLTPEMFDDLMYSIKKLKMNN